jgi:hypothetical protein
MYIMNYNKDNLLKKMDHINYNNNLNTLIEDISLDGTNLNDLSKINYTSKKSNIINKNMLKTITNEIINNLKENSNDENNIDILDDEIDDEKQNIDDEETIIDDEKQIINGKKKSKKKNKEKLDNFIKNNIENFVEDKIPIKNSKNILAYIFDDCFGVKDFILLFSIYFILSQDMIKDLFAGYFTCLNPDNEGKVGVKGVIVYGLLLTIIFMLSKKYLVQ